MDSADMNEVFKRLAAKEKPLLDERAAELPIPVEHQLAEPLFKEGRAHAL